MTVTVRWASPADSADLAQILCEMAVHYRQPPLAEDRAVAAAHAWLSAESPASPHFALAWRAGALAGMASVAIAHPGIDLTTEGWNNALDFYEKRGAVRHDQKIFLRFDTDALRALAAR